MARRGYSLLPASHFRGGSDGKESAYNAGSIPGLERCSGDGMATHSSIFAWRIPRTDGPGGLQSTGSQRDGHG